MARRTSGRPQGGYDERPEEAGHRPRRARRSGGNEGLWIALGAALVVVVILVLIFAGGESEEELQASAKDSLIRVFELAFDDRVEEGMQLVEAREILRDVARELMKKWTELSPQERDAFRRQAFGLVRQRLVPPRDVQGRVRQGIDLRILQKSEIPALLTNATYRVTDAGKRVDITFNRDGYDWCAQMRRVEGGWLLSRLDRLGN